MRLIGAIWMAAGVALAAQQLPSKPGVLPPPVEARKPAPAPPPSERPLRLMTAQELAWAAYPELRARGLQLRVDEIASGSTVTIGFAERDRDDLLGLSRPREAQLVIDAAFDAADALRSASLRGPLTHTAERRRVRAMGNGWTDTLRNEGAVYGPDKRAALLHDLDLAPLSKVLGRLTPTGAAFQAGTADDGLYWNVSATRANGGAMTLGFEPYAGRLVRVVSGGGQ